VGENYDEEIKSLAQSNPAVDAELFDILGPIKHMTSDYGHEQSWVAWDSQHPHLFLAAFNAVGHEI
jgi:hypothetical protein